MQLLFWVLGVAAAFTSGEQLGLNLGKDLDAIEKQIPGLLKFIRTHGKSDDLTALDDEGVGKKHGKLVDLKSRIKTSKQHQKSDSEQQLQKKEKDEDESFEPANRVAAAPPRAKAPVAAVVAQMVPPAVLRTRRSASEMEVDGAAGLKVFKPVQSLQTNVQATLLQIARQNKMLATMKRNAKELARQIKEGKQELLREKSVLQQQSKSLVESVTRFANNVEPEDASIKKPKPKATVTAFTKEQHDIDVKNAVRIATQELEIKHLKELVEQRKKLKFNRPKFVLPVKPTDAEQLEEARQAAQEKSGILSSLHSEIGYNDGLSYLDDDKI